MALLKLETRKAIFKELGLGAYNKKSIEAFQKKWLYRKSDWDGVYGKNTDNALRTVYYTKKYTKNFNAKEFRCECGGRYCCGFPSYMKPAELIQIQKIRDHWGRPITITCGLRDKTYNATLGGSVQNSLHLKGQALDFYMSGVTDTLRNRKAAIRWIKKQANHHYTYGNGINSNGYYVHAPYMGNALHTDTYNNVKPKHPKWVEPKKTATKKTTTTETSKKKVAETVADKVLKACKEQSVWMKNAKYGSWSPVTLAHSKKHGTCVTYVGCVLQRLGYLKSGGYIWHNGKGYGTGKVRIKGATSKKMTTTYMGNKTLTSLKSQLKAGDIILLDDNKSGVKGSGGHVFILTGKWTSKGNPYIWDQEPTEKCIKSQKARTYSGSRKVLARVRPK